MSISSAVVVRDDHGVVLTGHINTTHQTAAFSSVSFTSAGSTAKKERALSVLILQF